MIVLFIWGYFYARRMLVDPRSRVCMGRRWGKDLHGNFGHWDWYEPEIHSVRDLLRDILPGGASAPRTTTPPNSKRRSPGMTPGGSDTRLTSGSASGASTTLSSQSNSPRGAGARGGAGGGSRTLSQAAAPLHM